jgi:hypothetical protein
MAGQERQNGQLADGQGMMAKACMGARGWILVSSAREMADAYNRAWQAEVDRHEKGEAGRLT